MENLALVPRLCKKCLQEKPFNEFYQKQNCCKVCTLKIIKEWNAKNLAIGKGKNWRSPKPRKFL